MNLEELWVGDRVIITHSQRVGIFEGINSQGKARVKIGNKILLIKSENIQPAPEKIRNNNLEQLEISLQSEKIDPIQSIIDFIPEIDLHIERLQSSKTHDNPLAILEFQLRKLKDFMDEAIKLRLAKVTIIHGKGTGALRMETMGIIDNYPEKASIYPINNDGGMIVYLRYSK